MFWWRKSVEKKCLFCGIAAKETPATIRLETEDLVIFEDIKPVARTHLLVIPRRHLDNLNSLTKDDVVLVENMIEAAKLELDKENIENDAEKNDVLFGFHRPFFNTVRHLHLHCIRPTAEISAMHRIMFKPNSLWFSTADEVLQNLKSKI